MGVHGFKYNKLPIFLKTREYQYFDVCCPETSSCASKPLLLRCNLVIPQCICQVSLGLKEVQVGAHDYKYNKVPLFLLENHGISILRCMLNPETSSCASKPLLLRCNLVIPQCMCQVSLGLKEVQMVTHDFKYNKVPLFARKPGNINTSIIAVQKRVLVPASRYYCDVTWSYHNVCIKLH